MYISGRKRGTRFKSHQANEWQKMVIDILSHEETVPVGLLSIDIELHGSWYTQNNTVRKKDLDNYLKCLIDCVTKGIGVDDSWVFNLNARKVESLKEKTVVHIHCIDEH